jgi:hypothetical protein
MVQRLCCCWSILITSSRGLLSCGRAAAKHKDQNYYAIQQSLLARAWAHKSRNTAAWNSTNSEELQTKWRRHSLLGMHEERIQAGSCALKISSLKVQHQCSNQQLLASLEDTYADLCGASTACHALYQPRNPGAR